MLLPLECGQVRRHRCTANIVWKERFVLQRIVAQGSAEVACVELLGMQLNTCHFRKHGVLWRSWSGFFDGNAERQLELQRGRFLRAF